TERQAELAEARGRASGKSPEEMVAGWAAEIPARRLADPAEIAAAVAFLASERAAYITGVTLQVYGGLVRGPYLRDASDEPTNATWRRAPAVRIAHYWSGAPAPAPRQAEARFLWSDAFLYVRFVAPRGEPLVVNDKPKLDEKTLGLWERDVCELFVAPDADAPE